MSESEEKTEDASKRKLKKQREQGSLPRTADMTSILSVIIGIIILAATSRSIYASYAEMFDNIMLAMRMEGSQTMNIGLNTMISSVFKMTIALIAIGVTTTVLVTILYQGGLPFSMTPLTPDFNRLNPAQGFERMFNRRSFIEALIHLMRACIWFVICTILMWSIWPNLFRLDLCGNLCGLELSHALIWRFIPTTIFFLSVFMAIEMIVQKSLYLHEQKMSKSDVKRENKEQMGSPELRQERNRLRKELAKEAENADKSLANMCFYYADVAVAIRYHPKLAPIPKVSAKAKGEEAVHLRAYVQERGYPILAHPTIAIGCSKIAPGASVTKDLFEDLAIAMTKMFGGRVE